MSKPDVVIPPVHYRREKKTPLQRLVRSFSAPFRDVLGGPELDDCRHYRVDCGSLEIEFYLPRAVLGGGTVFPQQVDLSDSTTFVACESKGDRTGHRVCKLGVSNWAYRPPRITLDKFLPIPREPYVVVTAYWQLERIKNGIQLEVGNTSLLEQYLHDDFYAYLESEGGHNWKVREEESMELGPEGRGWTQPEIEQAIAARSWAPPKAYQEVRFNGQPWLRYNWSPRQNYPKSLLYTCTLTPDTLFTVRFSLVQMIGGSLRHWWSPLVEDSEILMDGVKVYDRALP